MELKSIKKKFDRVLALVLTIVALVVGQSVWAASSFTVAIQASTSSSCTFRITRTGNTTVSETIEWRVVSLSAMAGMHFTGYNGNYSGTVTFNVNETYKDVPITETTPSGTNSDCFQYQNTTTRSYRFEVLDKNGDILASKDRTITTGTQFTNAYVNQSVTDLVYFTNNGNISSGSGNKYLDVSYSSSNWIQVTDGGYKQGVHTVSTNSLYNNNSNLRSYLHNRGYKMYATVYFTQKEEQDGYQYIQIYTGSAGTYDTGNDPNGGVDNPSNSLYKACFILSYSPSGSVMSDPHYQFFPHRYDYVDKATETSHNITRYEFDYDNSYLYKQKFKTASPSYQASNSGSLVLPTATENIHIRFDAGGSDGDTWDFKNLKVRLALVDNAAPIVINNYMVSGGRHQKGNTIYVSVPFKEIVTVTGTPTLTSNWGTLSYTAGSGSNVLTFKGTIDPTDNNPFSVSSYSLNGGTIKDLAGNSFSGSISHSFGTTLDADYAWSTSDFNSLAANTYEIASKIDLRHLALLVNVAKNVCTGLTFRQTQDITCDNTYTPIGYNNGNSDWVGFRGTYDGDGKTVSGITVNRTGDTSADGYVGLFGYVNYNSSTDYGTVRNVVLANSTFTGCDFVGGIVGENSGGIVENCRVESTVTINAGADNSIRHGGIVGYNYSDYAKVIGCYSAAVVSNNSKSSCKQYGGIVGYNYKGTVKDCLYTGSTVTADNKKGAIVGTDDDNYGVFTNNYYTAISLGGVNGSDRDGARRARTVSLGSGVAIAGSQTAYSASGLTAIGTTALQSGTAIYSGEGQTVGLAYTATVPEGFMVTYSATAGTLSGTTLTMPAADVEVSAATAPDYATHWHADADHDGTTAQRAYIISTTTGLNLLATLVNGTVSGYPANDFSGKFFLLGGNIEYSSGTDWNNTDNSNTENNFTAIGGDTGTKYYFKGTFDGGGNTISGIRITQKNKDSQGLFGYIGTGGTVKDLTLSNARIFSNKTGVGGIAGDSQGTIANCHVTADVNILGNDNYHGGIAGNNYTGTITGCTSAAVLNGRGSYRGGITGQSSGGTLSDCIVTGLSYSYADSYAGAIVGKNIAGTLSNNYYHDCSVNGATTNIGVGTSTAGVSNDVDGTKSVHTLTLGADITATPGTVESVTISGTTYYTAGSTFTLSYTGTVPANHIVVYSVGTQALSGTTLTMSAADATVSAEVMTKWDWLNRQFAAASTDEDFPTLITLTEDYTAEATDSYLTIPSGRYVTLDLNGFTLDRNLTEAKTDGYVIRAIGNLTVRDSDPNAVHSGTAITGGIITRGNSSDKGGGLYIYGGSNAFPSVTLEGGTIIGNGAGHGGGVYVENGRFYMTGGTISCNVARTYGGGVYVNTNSFFDMTGGTISGNVAKSDGGGVYAYTGSTFTMTGGTVSDNTAKIQGGGVYVYRSTFTLTDSEIAHNDARNNGGGIYVSSGTLTMADGTITDNTATISGGGVYLSGTISASGTFTMTGGTITGNTANNGGGVYVSGNSTFNQESGVISTNAARKGGGVYISSSGSSFNLTDGTITGNTADLGNNGKGGGVFLNDGVFAISGGPAVTGNTNVYDDLADNIYLNTGNLITVGGLLTAGARMGVASYDLTGTFTYGGTFADDEAVLAVFFSDRIGYGIVADNGEAALATAYTVTIDPSIEHGTVTASLANAVAGQTVTLTVTPNAGYAINTVNYNDGTDHEITPSEGVYSFTMPASNITVSATFAMTWASLNAAMQNDGCFTLPYDITATETDIYLYVPSGKTVTLDLNGHTINRNLTAAVSNGYVIRVEGTLTINDSSDSNTGTITGGYNSYQGGGVYVSGNFTMNGGTISNNTATYSVSGGGVYVDGSNGVFNMNGGTICGNTGHDGGGVFVGSSGNNLGVFTMTGGTISGNTGYNGGGVNNLGIFTMTGGNISNNDITSYNGGGVYMENGSFNISGSPVISGNIKRGSSTSSPDNVCLKSGKVITVTGALTNAARIGVTTWTKPTAGTPVTFVQGSSYTPTIGDISCFSSDNSAYGVYLNGSGEAALGVAYAVNIDGGITNGTVSADQVTAAAGAIVTLTVSPAEGYSINTVSYNDGTDHEITAVNDVYSFTMPAGNVTVTATYKKASISISFIDNSGVTVEGIKAIPLDNTMTTLEAGSYYVNSDLTFTGTVTMTGNVNLILGDGCTMNIGSINGRINGKGISLPGNASLTIFYQRARTGALNIYTTGDDNNGIQAKAITIEGGNITVDTEGQDARAIYAVNGDVYIKNGNITVTAASSDAILVDNGNFKFRGGNLTTSAHNGYAIEVSASAGRYDLTRRNEKDCVIIGSTGLYYQDATTVNFDGMFTDGTNIYYRTNLTGSEIKTLAGKTLRPVLGVYLDDGGVFPNGDASNREAELTWNNNDPVIIPIDLTVEKVVLEREFTVGKPATIMLPFSKNVSDISGATFYTFGGVTYNSTTGKWEATMNEVAGSITANTPYLVMPSDTCITLNGGATLNTTGGGGQQTAQSGSNWTFKGTYEYREWYADGANADEIGKAYGFAGVERTDLNVEVGDFVKVAEGARIRPKGCYLLWSNTPNASLAPARGMNRAASVDELPGSITVRLVGANGQVTGIGELDIQTGEITFDADSWYTLDGIRLNGKPVKSGIYINNGKQVSIKYGE